MYACTIIHSDSLLLIPHLLLSPFHHYHPLSTHPHQSFLGSLLSILFCDPSSLKKAIYVTSGLELPLEPLKAMISPLPESISSKQFSSERLGSLSPYSIPTWLDDRLIYIHRLCAGTYSCHKFVLLRRMTFHRLSICWFYIIPLLQFSLSFREEKINLFLRFEHSSTIYYQYLVQPWVYIDRLLTRKRDFSTSENTITPRIHSLLNKNDSLRNGIPPYQLLVWKAVEIYRTVHDIALDYQTQLYSVTVLLKTLYTLASGYRGINLKLTKKLPLWC